MAWRSHIFIEDTIVGDRKHRTMFTKIRLSYSILIEIGQTNYHYVPDVETQLWLKFEVNQRSLNPPDKHIFFWIKEIEIELVFYHRRILKMIQQITTVCEYL